MFNQEARKLAKIKNSFPSEDSLRRLFISKRLAITLHGQLRKWRAAYEGLQIIFLETYGNECTQESCRYHTPRGWIEGLHFTNKITSIKSKAKY
jgi:hypothetical protein